MVNKYRDDGVGKYWDGTIEEEQVYLESLIPEKCEALWQAAHEYEYLRISGSAIGMLVLGVLQGKPKCVAVQSWIQSIWNLYYQRKVLVTVMDEPNLDFSSCGEIPYTVPELMEELGF